MVRFDGVTPEYDRLDVGFGSKADIRRAEPDVRFTPESGHPRCGLVGPLRAKISHRQATFYQRLGVGPAAL